MANTVKLNELKPILKKCNIYAGDRNIVVEDATSKAQIVLPKDNAKILDLLDGNHSIKDITSELYKAEGKVSFHSIITTVKLLKEGNLLDGIDHDFSVQEEKGPHEQKPSILNRALFEFNVSGKLTCKRCNDWTFFALTGLLLSLLFLNHQHLGHLNLARFLKSPLGYNEAVFRVFIISSVLMSVKAFLQGSLLLFSTGMVYGASFRVFPYALSFGINDNSLYAHPRKTVIITYGVMSSLLYIITASTLASVPALRPYRNDIGIFSLLLTLMEMNPYRRSDLTKLFYFFYAEKELKSIMPYLKNCTLKGLWDDTGTRIADELRYITYSVLAIAWVIGFSMFSFEIILKSFPSLFYEMQLGGTQSKYGAMVVFAGLMFMTGYLLLDLFHTLMRNIISPVLAPLRKLQMRSKQYEEDAIDHAFLHGALKGNMLFNQFSNEALSFLVNHSKLKTLKKGSPLIVQGDRGRDVYFLIKGSVDVTVTEKTGRDKHIVTMGANSVIGEMSILEKTKRSANVSAKEDIVYLEMPEKVFGYLMSDENFQQDFNKLKKRIEISQFVSSANLFKDFPPEIMNLFVEAGDLVLFPAGHNIVDEGEKDKTFYLLIKGKVDIYKDNEKIAQLGQGDFFGEVALVANVPRTATVKTVEDSLFLYIEDKKFWNILSQNIELAMYIESVGRHRMAEAA